MRVAMGFKLKNSKSKKHGEECTCWDPILNPNAPRHPGAWAYCAVPDPPAPHHAPRPYPHAAVLTTLGDPNADAREFSRTEGGKWVNSNGMPIGEWMDKYHPGPAADAELRQFMGTEPRRREATPPPQRAPHHALRPLDAGRARCDFV